MKKQTILTGQLFILASITFWISWFLMPDPGTTDTNHILSIVKQNRTSVLSSVTIQIISSVIYMIALFSFSRFNLIQKRISWIGVIVFAIGVLGLCSDAFFHLLAYYMTDASVTIQQDVVRVMEFMQTDALIFLVPILLPLFIGSLLLAVGFSKQRLISRMPALLCVSGFIVLIVGNAIPNLMGVNQIPHLILFVFSVFAIAQAWMGVELIKAMKWKEALVFATNK